MQQHLLQRWCPAALQQACDIYTGDKQGMEYPHLSIGLMWHDGVR